MVFTPIRTATMFALLLGAAVSIFYSFTRRHAAITKTTKSDLLSVRKYLNTSKLMKNIPYCEQHQNYLSYEYWSLNTYTDTNCKFSQHYNDVMDAISGKSITTTRHQQQHSLFKRFQMKDIALCFDSLTDSRNGTFHIAFIGDSLVRNQFLSFLQLFPDYDRKLSDRLEYHFHTDINVSFPLFNDLIISFRWRPYINALLLADLKSWAALDVHQYADYIFIGSTVHNMAQFRNGNLSDQSFENLMKEDLMPVLLNNLAAHPRQQIFWLSQTPTTDLFGPVTMQSSYNGIYLPKIRFYNNIIHRALKGTPIGIWESSIPAVEEHLRGCAVLAFGRQDYFEYFHCKDYLIHPGYVALSLGTQIIFNHLCNKNGSRNG